VSRFRDSDFIPVSDFDRSLDATKTSLPGGSQYGEHLQTRQVRELIGRRDQPTGTHALFLGWDVIDAAQVPTYTIALPEALQLGWWLDEGAILSFCLGDTGERCESGSAEGSAPPDANSGDEQACAADPNHGDRAPIDLTLELVAAGGITAKLPLSHVRPLPRAIPVTLSKWPRWEKAEYKASVEPVLQTFEIPLGEFVKNNPDFDPGQLRQIRFRFDRTRSGVVILDEVGLARNRYASFAP
jgi:hypothetical protein